MWACGSWCREALAVSDSYKFAGARHDLIIYDALGPMPTACTCVNVSSAEHE